MLADQAIHGAPRPLPSLDLSTLSPGVRNLVAVLREAGLFTTDSGDGSNYAAGMECALPYPHVFIVCPVGKANDAAAIACQRPVKPATAEP